MKRGQKRAHLLIWLVLGPLILGVFVLSIAVRPDAPLNEDLPDTLVVGAR